MMAEIFLRKFIHLDTDLFISIMFELRCTKFRIVHKTMVDPLKISFSNYGQHDDLFVLKFSHIDGHEVVSS